MNKLSMGARVYQLHGSNGESRPKEYEIEFVGVVSTLNKEDKLIGFDNVLISEKTKDQFLKPNIEGISHFFNEPPVLKKTNKQGLYLVPADELLLHINTYKSPW